MHWTIGDVHVTRVEEQIGAKFGDPANPLLVQLVLSLGIYFSAYAASYSLSNLHPTFYSYVSYMVPVIGCLLPLSWAYAFWRVPEEARLSPQRLAMAASR